MKTYLAVIGIAFLTLALALFVRRMSAVMRGASTLGQVKDHEVRTSDDETYYLPIVHFADTSGAWHRSFLHMWGAPLGCAVLGTVAALAGFQLLP